MKKLLTAFFALALASQASASGTTGKQIDTIQNSTGGSAISVPSTGTTLATDTNTLTLQNKTISGSNNTVSGLSASAISSGQIGVANGGTGASTLTSNGILQGNGTAAVTAVGPGTQYQVLQAGSGGVPAFGSVALGQSAAVSGQLPVANGGTGLGTLTSGNVIIGAGTSSPTFVAPGTSGNVLTSNGSTWVSQAASSSAPTVTGSFASGTSITAVGGISFAGGSANTSINYIVGSGGAVTVTASPQISVGSVAGQMLTLIGTSATNTVKLQDGTGLALNGPWTGGLSSSISLIWDSGASVWREISRNN